MLELGFIRAKFHSYSVPGGFVVLAIRRLRDRRLFLFVLPTPHTLHPTPYTLHPTPHTPHPTPNPQDLIAIS
ncbi:MAG: hypothetical protein PX634_12360 [Microcystis sp. M53600_WE12]|nr:hypothetical protein [Microcystis sp. M53600_WE12]